MDIRKYVRSIPGFPKPGIIFRDITPILSDANCFRYSIDRLCDLFQNSGADKVVAAEARGFMFAAGISYKLGWGLVPIRKPGKLPWKTKRREYDLEYGTGELHIHTDAVANGEKVLLIDDLLATGGTAKAMINLVEDLGGVVVGLGFVIELDDLKGRKMLDGYRVESLEHYEGE
ncbi:MAG: adenine phosphoribosyltransferase [Planctomycetota bacterium]|jgi:adenine phosphoribosyltransferase|nr:adenine phosphoribosyltransferase [Planctomycetota bacterium]